jgi:Phage portal protein, SPP1 Gp6-like
MIVPLNEVEQVATMVMSIRSAEQIRLRRISQYMRGKHSPPYAPRGVNAEYRWIMRKSIRNFMPLVVSVISGNLHVDGYKPSGTTTIETASSPDAEPSWNAFRANRMISRQHGVHRALCRYGTAYCVVLPGVMATDEELESNDVPVIRPVSPRRMTALYADDIDDEWAQLAIEVKVAGNPARPQEQKLIVSLYDQSARYILTSDEGVGIVQPDYQVQLHMADPNDPLLNGQDPISYHGLGICPAVRFLYEADLDGETDCSGEVEPIMPIQDQINFGTFNEMMSEQYAAFRQRWVTGMAPADPEGREVTPFRPGVDRVWAAEDATTKFGEFDATALQPYIDVRDSAIQHMATITQIPPYYLLGQVANLSAEALAAARDGLDRKIQELQAILTDPWRNVFRLSGLASGDKETWNDLNGEVVWRDTSARAFAATIDGLGKAAQMLGVPVEELWRRIPGVTADDVNSWMQARQHQNAQEIVQQAVQQAVQTQPAQATVTGSAGGLQANIPVALPPGAEQGTPITVTPPQAPASGTPGAT